MSDDKPWWGTYRGLNSCFCLLTDVLCAGRPKLSRWAYSHEKHDEEFYTVNGKNNSSGLSGGEGMHKRDNHISSAISSGDKVHLA